MADGSIIIPPC